MHQSIRLFTSKPLKISDKEYSKKYGKLFKITFSRQLLSLNTGLFCVSGWIALLLDLWNNCDAVHSLIKNKNKKAGWRFALLFVVFMSYQCCSLLSLSFPLFHSEIPMKEQVFVIIVNKTTENTLKMTLHEIRIVISVIQSVSFKNCNELQQKYWEHLTSHMQMYQYDGPRVKWISNFTPLFTSEVILLNPLSWKLSFGNVSNSLFICHFTHPTPSLNF